MDEEEGCFDPVLSVKFEQALFFRGFSGDRRQARDAREGGVYFSRLPRSRVYHAQKKLANTDLFQVAAFACLRSPGKREKKCFFRRQDETHYRIRLPIRSCIPVRAGYVDTSYSRLSAFLPSVAFRTTNRHTVSFIRCLKFISTWIRAYLKET